MAKLDNARVTAKIIMHGSHATVLEVKRIMSTDLPAEHLGELVCEAVNEAWRSGLDPVNFDVVVVFG